ncbi:hypothetical protein GCM10023091_35170 [Ravibacter arvi]|uniref:Glycosyl transferase family 1 domain-containing protein n=1 Tax=Ravibacter arvi TaxID=2051041 RepID=A0ABP8M7A8_9BACT
MKILFITPSFSTGGAEKNMLNIINSINESDFDIYLIVCTRHSNYATLLNKRIKLYQLGYSDVKGAFPEVFKLIREIRPSIVFTSALHLSLPILFLKKIGVFSFAKITRIPSLPSNRLGTGGVKGKVMDFFAGKLLNTSTAIIAQTARMRDEVISFYKAKPEKVVLISNIVDLETIKRMANEAVTKVTSSFVFIAAGSLYSAKGFDFLIRAFEMHVREFPSTELHIIGEESVEPGYRNYLESLISELKLSKNVFLLGYKQNPYKYFSNADAFVLSSVKEGFPNVVLENIALNKPVLVTDCVDFNGIVNQDNGVVVAKQSVEALLFGLKEVRKLKPKASSFDNFDFNRWFKTLTK